MLYSNIPVLVSILFYQYFGQAEIENMPFQKIKSQISLKEKVENYMLAELSNIYSNFHHVDLRGQFPHVNSWDNEIHLKSKGYKEVAKRYDEKMCEILKYNITKKLQNMIIA